MTLQEYDRKIDVLYEWYKATKKEEDFKPIIDLQYKYMGEVVDTYTKNINGDPAKKICGDLLSYAVYSSQSGNSIVKIESKEIANKVKDIIWDELGDYLLDADVYPCYDCYVIDCMFGGKYVPEWDGWEVMP